MPFTEQGITRQYINVVLKLGLRCKLLYLSCSAQDSACVQMQTGKNWVDCVDVGPFSEYTETLRYLKGTAE